MVTPATTLVDAGPCAPEVVATGHYRLVVPGCLLQFDVQHLRWSGGELTGEMSVTLDQLGTAGVNNQLSRANLRLTDARARTDRAKLLAEKSRDDKIPFDPLVELICTYAIDQARQKDDTAATGLKSFGDALSCYRSTLGEESSRLAMGIPLLDRAMRGLSPGELFLLLARTDSLKTMFLTNLIGTWCAKYSGFSWVLAELEMRRDQVLSRLARQHFGLTNAELEGAMLRGTLDEQALLHRFRHLHFVDEGAVSLDRIGEYTRELDRASEAPVAAVLVDHAGLIKAAGGTAYERATETAIGLKQLARRLDVAVIAVVQANRSAAGNTDPVALESARDSGAFEENADFVLSFSQQIEPADGRTPFVKAMLKKNRRGPRVNFSIGFDPKTLRMAEVEIPGGQ